MMYFFQARALFSIEYAKFWPVLTIIGYFVENLRTFWFGAPFTGLDIAAVPQN